MDDYYKKQLDQVRGSMNISVKFYGRNTGAETNTMDLTEQSITDIIAFLKEQKKALKKSLTTCPSCNKKYDHLGRCKCCNRDAF